MNMKKLIALLIAIVALSCSKKSRGDDVSFDGTLTINNISSLDEAISFGNQVSTLTGNLTVTTGGSTGISSTLVSQVTALITSVEGNVTISTPDGGLNLSRLTSVSGNYSITGVDATDDALATVGGNIELNYPGGYDMPNLTSAGDIDLTPIETQSSKSGVNNPGKINFPMADASSMSTNGDPDGTLNFGTQSITDFNFGPGIKIINVFSESPVRPTRVVSFFSGDLPSLSINVNADQISFHANSVSGDLSITSGGDGSVELPNLETINGNATMNVPKITANNLTSITGHLNISTNTVSMTKLNTVGGNIDVKGTTENSNANLVNFENLTNVGGELNIQATEVSQNTGQPHNSGGSSHNSGGN